MLILLIMDADGAVLTYTNAFLSKYKIKTNFLSYHGVLRRYKVTFSPHLNKTEKGVEEPKPSFPFTHCRAICKMLFQKKASPRHEARQNGLLKMLYSIPFRSELEENLLLAFFFFCTKETESSICSYFSLV